METVIRLATPADAEQVRVIYEPIVRETAISFELEPPRLEEMRRRIEESLAGRPWLVCARGDEVLGYAYASQHRSRPAYQWSVDTSVYIRPDAQRRGIARALYQSLLSILVLQHYYNAYAGIALPNPGSVGLHEAVGFKPVGVYQQVGYKLGRWHDVGWWALELQAKPAEPQAPIPLAVVREEPGWAIALNAGRAWLRL